jgi:hypothetical protein
MELLCICVVSSSRRKLDIFKMSTKYTPEEIQRRLASADATLEYVKRCKAERGPLTAAEDVADEKYMQRITKEMRTMLRKFA